MENMATNTATINLEEELTTIRCACAAADAAGRDQIEHAIKAGRHFILVRDHIGHGFRGWLHKYGLKKTVAYDYILLAENEESVRRAGHISLRAALRALPAKSGKPNKTTKPNSSPTGSPFTKAAFTKLTIDGRRSSLMQSASMTSWRPSLFAFRPEDAGLVVNKRARLRISIRRSRTRSARRFRIKRRQRRRTRRPWASSPC